MMACCTTSLIETGETNGGQLEDARRRRRSRRPASPPRRSGHGDLLKKVGPHPRLGHYLRAVFMYGQEERTPRFPKAAAAFDELQRAPYADKMRRALLS